MIFAVIAEELGLVGSLGVIAAYVAFAYAGLRIAMRCTNPFGKTLAAGIVTLVCAQAAGQSRRRPRARSADGHPAAVRLVRRLEPGGRARRRRDPPLTSVAIVKPNEQLACLIAAGGTAGIRHRRWRWPTRCGGGT